MYVLFISVVNWLSMKKSCHKHRNLKIQWHYEIWKINLPSLKDAWSWGSVWSSLSPQQHACLSLKMGTALCPSTSDLFDPPNGLICLSSDSVDRVVLLQNWQSCLSPIRGKSFFNNVQREILCQKGQNDISHYRQTKLFVSQEGQSCLSFKNS